LTEGGGAKSFAPREAAFMSEFLVTGATGFVGAHLVAALRARGHGVRVLALAGEDTGALERAHRVAVHRGDVRDLAAVRAAIAGVERVIHLAAIHGLWRARAEYEAVNVGGTENLARAALEAGVARLVHVSSWAVYGMGHAAPIPEDAPLAPDDDPYALTKAEADRRVARLVAEHGLPAVIVRPGTMIGPGDRVNYGRMAERLRTGRAVVIGSGRNAVPFVDVRNAVDGMVLAAEADAVPGRVYHLGPSEPLTQVELWAALAEDLGVAPPRLRVPYAALFAAAVVAERAHALGLSRGQPLVTRLGVRMFGSENRLVVERAGRELGWTPRGSVRDALRLAAEWWARDASFPARAAPSPSA
jgi:nucleoside-diphosphate-sugar epimerase